MEKFELQKIREIPIESVAVSLGLTVHKHKALCPFHQDQHPSLSFHTGRNTYKCFVCDAHGSVIDLAMQVLNKNFKEACQWLASQHGVIISHPELVSGSENLQMLKQVQHDKEASSFDATKYNKYFQHPYLNAAARQFLFQERKLHPAVVRWCRLHSYTDRHGTPWLQIPYYDVEGNLIGVQSRRLGPRHPEHPNSHPELVSGSENGQMLKQVQHDVPRFIFPKGSQCRIYNQQILKLLKPGEDLWIAEGASDCWALLSSGHKAVAIPSATLLKAKDLEILKGLSLHMFPDRDIPGEKLFLQLKAHLPQLVRHSLPTGCKDYSDYYCHPELVSGSVPKP